MITLSANGGLFVAALCALAPQEPLTPPTAAGSPRTGPERPRAVLSYREMLDFWDRELGLEDDPPPGDRLESSLAPGFSSERIAKALQDECYAGIGQDGTGTPPDCPQGSRPKIDGAYLWGMGFDGSADSGAWPRLWFGTGNNTHCLAAPTFLALETTPSENSDYVCEFGESQLARQNPFWPDELGDFRPAQLFTWVSLVPGASPEGASGFLIDRTPQITGISRSRLEVTAGFRTVGINDGVVLAGGPNIGLTGGINLFAFSTNGAFLGSATLGAYSNIRKFVRIDGRLYTGVLNSTSNFRQGGTVLRWTGSVGSPFQFTEVGWIDNEVSELAVHEEHLAGGTVVKRLIAGTWPHLFAPQGGGPGLAGLWVSPPIPAAGLSFAHAQGWTQIWRVDAYEPDPVTARAYGIGGLAVSGDWAYWGTMNPPAMGLRAWREQHGEPATPAERDQVIAGTYRAISIFRAPLSGTTLTAQGFAPDLLYGAERLLVYDPTAHGFVLTPNGLGIALAGRAGFGNAYNVYAWVALARNGLVYIGTLDSSYLWYGIQGGPPAVPPGLPRRGARNWGADLWVFAEGGVSARSVDTRGFGNDRNIGIRNAVVGDGAIYVGTANVSNLHPDGGWELIRLVPPF
jgi:hypothetical protein